MKLVGLKSYVNSKRKVGITLNHILYDDEEMRLVIPVYSVFLLHSATNTFFK